MSKRRGLAACVVLAVVATAWLLFGRRDAERTSRADRPADAAAEFQKLPAESKPGAAAKGEKPPVGEAPPPAPAVATAGLRVRVIDVDGAPAAGATVEAFRTLDSSFPRALAAATTTGRDGRATLALPPGVTYMVRASRGEAANIPAWVAPGGPEATLVLELSRPFRGLVLLPDGAPARGHFVQLTFTHAGHTVRFDGTTDDGGAFDLLPLPDAWLDRLTAEVRAPGEMKLGSPDKSPACVHWVFEFARKDLLAGTITLQLTEVRLHARVVSEEGTPIAQALVYWAPPSAPDAPSFRCVAVTDEDGRFHAGLQRIAGEAFVIRAPGYAPLVWRPEALPADRKMHVPEIVLRRGLRLAGLAADSAGKPIAGAWVRLESPRLPGQVVDQGMTDEHGRFQFDVADEAHVLYAFRPVDPDLCLPVLRMAGVRGGPDDVRVVLPSPVYGTVRFVAERTREALSVHHLTLIVKDARGAEVAKRTWELWPALGQVRFEVWDEGTYQLEVYTAHQEPAKVSGVSVVRGRGPEVLVPLVPRR